VIDSTNNRALDFSRAPNIQTPLLVLAERQTDGRGRGKNGWWARQGALTFSLLVKTDTLQIPVRRLPQASLTAGLAVCEAIEDFMDESVSLKWPNDVYIRDRKVCGILIELPPEREGVVVIGIGINVNNTAEQAPEQLQPSAIAMCDVAGHPFSLIDVLIRVLNHLEQRLRWIGHQDDELRARWSQRCMLTGRKVQLKLGGRSVAGMCHGIDDEGALLIETADGTERHFSGTVSRF
jgi:BirA family biotin operon repressor/biotin-[acetyl-CoA-carboxylase] ligase